MQRLPGPRLPAKRPGPSSLTASYFLSFAKYLSLLPQRAAPLFGKDAGPSPAVFLRRLVRGRSGKPLQFLLDLSGTAVSKLWKIRCLGFLSIGMQIELNEALHGWTLRVYYAPKTAATKPLRTIYSRPASRDFCNLLSPLPFRWLVAGSRGM